MAKFITYKSDVISGSIMQVPSIVADLTGTASYGLYFVTAAFASNASGSWLSSSFNLPSSSTETIIGFDPAGVAAIYSAPTGSYLGVNYGGNAWPYLTIKNGSAGWSTPVVKNATSVPMISNEIYFNFSSAPNYFRLVTSASIIRPDGPIIPVEYLSVTSSLTPLTLSVYSLDTAPTLFIPVDYLSVTSSFTPRVLNIYSLDNTPTLFIPVNYLSVTSSLTPIFIGIGYTTGST